MYLFDKTPLDVKITSKGYNIFGCDQFEEIDLGVYMIKSHGTDFIKESTTKHKDHPVVSFDILHENVVYKSVPFLLVKQKNIVLNEQTLTYSVEYIPTPEVIIEQKAVVDDNLHELISIELPKYEHLIENQKNNIVEYYNNHRAENEKYITNIFSKQLKSAINKVEQFTEKYKNTFIDNLTNTSSTIKEKVTGSIIAELNLIKEDIESSVSKVVFNLFNSKKTELNNELHNESKNVQIGIKNILGKYIAEEIESIKDVINSNSALSAQQLSDKLTNLIEQAVDINNKLYLSNISKIDEAVIDSKQSLIDFFDKHKVDLKKESSKIIEENITNAIVPIGAKLDFDVSTIKDDLQIYVNNLLENKGP